MSQLETSFEGHLVRKLNARGYRCLKVKFLGRRGAPDRFVPKLRVFIETKRPKGGVLEDHQKREHDRLRAEGYEVLVMWTKKQVDAYVGWL
ncbi:VRR-NUC domain containing protein [uncultured Caudovirales phage]|uniref:VRR-NUC domain containing protein n=1 Tax=uncultured Caudovirales phage TaxID=2100421 RepID=A0A6J5SC34_9CAUD|nr:VRR-NUC domain containing protein [uncultured Caudovirales phage]CAB4197847.1 VRR-NUC domain containing protein [uncultured Caudovirales phage]CAB4211434.1 VRR-NUC domain containing protein [uncultured Caudovirales phage]CAB5227535.1 VRR-NUC domain containing protein [uncultured Caudovirales phage]